MDFLRKIPEIVKISIPDPEKNSGPEKIFRIHSNILDTSTFYYKIIFHRTGSNLLSVSPNKLKIIPLHQSSQNGIFLGWFRKYFRKH